MVKLSGLDKLYDNLVDSANALNESLQDQLKDIKKEFQTNLIKTKLELLEQICDDEDLDFEEMKIKYLKPKELKKFPSDKPKIPEKIKEEELLNKIILDGIEYYYEPKEDGKIYDQKCNHVGTYKNNKFLIK